MLTSEILDRGLSSYCPFCASIKWSAPQVGMRVLHLTGYRCGEVGEVIEVDSDPDVLICRYEGDPPEWSYREDRRYERLIPENIYFVPEWAPPASIDDAAEIHDRMLFGFSRAASCGEQDPEKAMLREIVALVWKRRLPLDFSDVWPMLDAHGWLPDARGLLAERYSFGLETLREACGNAAVKRKRMKPFSAFRYTPITRPR